MTRSIPSPLDFNILMAYADRTLPHEEMRKVAAIVAADPDFRRTVIGLRHVGLLIDRAYGDIDFNVGCDRFQRIVLGRNRNTLSAYTAGLRDRIAALRDRIMPAALPAVALAAVVGGAVLAGGPIIEALRNGAGYAPVSGPVMRTASGPGQLTRPGRAQSAHSQPVLALGEIGSGTELWRALEALQRGETTPVAAGSGSAFRGAMKFLDRYGNACHEVDVEEAGQHRHNLGVLVACQSDPGRWSLIAAAQTRDPGRSVARPYVTDADAAHDAMAGILKMIGARQQTTSLEEANSDR